MNDTIKKIELNSWAKMIDFTKQAIDDKENMHYILGTIDALANRTKELIESYGADALKQGEFEIFLQQGEFDADCWTPHDIACIERYLVENNGRGQLIRECMNDDTLSFESKLTDIGDLHFG